MSVIGAALVTSLSCSRTRQVRLDAENIRTFWGSKQECVDFLQSDKAIFERWLVEAIGE